VLGTQGARFDYETGYLVPLTTNWEKWRWRLVASLNLFARGIFILNLANSFLSDPPNSVLPVQWNYGGLAIISLLYDFHSFFNLSGLITLNNSTAKFYHRITSKNKITKNVRIYSRLIISYQVLTRTNLQYNRLIFQETGWTFQASQETRKIFTNLLHNFPIGAYRIH